MLEVTKENFAQEVLESDQVVMVDWWGPKCEHCLELMPDIEKLAEKYKDKMKFCSVNVSGNRRLAISYKVLGLPAILFFRNGEKIDELSGQDITIEDIESKIQQYLEK
ncbi:MAG TPA: thioredoxin domain-containing protein [Syntrophomonadaceae bacterium]|nr:thioredoxin domain-containing protein [Syntrophomonadaceae bacterium]HPU48478.1 thioredoxin domain-containing protein [Syntrophomonadaceae bacterium]